MGEQGSGAVAKRIGDPSQMQLVLMLGGMSVLGPLAINMYLPALTEVGKDLSASVTAIQQTVAFFMLGIAVGQLFWGAVADRVGRRRPLLTALAIFCVASFFCATAQSVAVLNGARLVQGAGASAGVVLARAIVSDHYEGAQAAGIMSWQQLIQGVAPIFSPLLGGLVLVIAGWRPIFWILMALGGALLLALLFRLPETHYRAPDATEAESWAGRYRAVIRNVPLFTQIMAGAFCAATLMIWYSGASPLFRTTFGWTVGVTSALLSALGVTIVAATQLNRRLLRRWTPRRIVEGTITFSIIGLVSVVPIALLDLPGANMIVAAALILATSGFGFISANNMANVLALDRGRAGSIAAMFGTASYGLGALIGLVVSYLPSWNGVSMLVMMIVVLSLARCLLLYSQGQAATMQSRKT